MAKKLINNGSDKCLMSTLNHTMSSPLNSTKNNKLETDTHQNTSEINPALVVVGGGSFSEVCVPLLSS